MPAWLAGRRSIDAASAAPGAHAVRAWLYSLAVLVVLMVAVGGATRLTGSGLSITEWKPVTGAIPPLTDAGWAAEFEKYRASSQYQNLNQGMSLAEFRFIYAWEWGHRQLGRLIGLAFFLPLAWFWWRGRVSGSLALALLGVGALGGLQATIGWIMVASGLKPGMVAVEPIKLALHLTVASVILSLLVWIATGLRGRRPLPAGLPAWPAVLLLGLVFLQIALGGLVAGSRAGLTYNTWPLMDGRLVPGPETLLVVRPWIENFVDNPALVQFNHRLVAYLVLALALWQVVAIRRQAPGSAAAGRATGLLALTLAQAALGVTTLLLAVPLWAGLAHQVLAMAVLTMATVHARLSLAERDRRVPLPLGAPATA
ncbi:MAG: COX15/CtaA family protein [Methylobacteriaceae bacterium]|nr:COX15/CtaA family protein [Methylobacteriaceae bacterium]